MKTRALLLLLALAAAGVADLPADPGQRPVIEFEALREGFREPDMLYAPFMFWFWDEPLEPGKMAEMARKLAGQRINPGYAHPRTTGPGVSPLNPLPPEQWLSPLWFDSFEEALREAEAKGMYLGYCDEYMWPSFQAAGRVVERDPSLRAVSLVWDTLDIAGGATMQIPSSFFVCAARHAGTPDLRPPVPEPRLGQWIWKPEPGAGPHHCCLRKTFELPAGVNVEHAAARLTVDNRYVLFINGREIGSSDDWYTVRTWDIAEALRPGLNVVAVDGGGDGGVDALVFGLRVELTGGEVVEVISDGSWRVAEQPAQGWRRPEFDDSGWAPVRVVEADTGASPWYILDRTRRPHTSATILSESLRVIGGGQPFEWQAPAGGAWRVYVFHKQQHGGPNYLDERLAPVFIEIAHRPYAERLGTRMGHSIPGVFVDNEGDYGNRLAWSDTLERRYRRTTGRDIRLWMPLLLDRDAEGRYAAARFDWFDAVSDLYAETMGSVSDWLAERDMYCIENLWEESLQWQAQYVGDFFKLSRAYSMPGTDALGRKALDVHDFKEAQSVSEFEGRRLMNELMGAGGWGVFTPEFIKQATNAVIAWGVGHVVPHGVFTNRNLDNAVWTPDWYDVNPMFPYLQLWADFTRRASYVNSHGRQAADVLLLNPMDSVWAAADSAVFDSATQGDLFRTDQWFGETVQHINDVYSDAVRQLSAHRVEFLVADRHYLRQMEVERGRLVRGEFSFHTVVLPPLVVLPLDVMEKLLAFARAGGRIYALDELPSGSTDLGIGDPRMAELVERLRAAPGFRVCEEGLERELEQGAPGLTPQVRFETGAFPMLQRRVIIDGRDLIWLANNQGELQSCEIVVAGARGRASIWDCETGEVRPVASQDTTDGARAALRFRPFEAFWLVFDPETPALRESATDSPLEEVARLDGIWQVRIDPTVQPNLQHPIEIPAEFLQGTGRPLQPWAEWGLERFSGLVEYRSEFTIDNANGAFSLDLGQCLYFAEVWINGQSFGARLWPPHVFDITGLLRRGRNQITVRAGNLVNNSYGDLRPSGLLGPVVLYRPEAGN